MYNKDVINVEYGVQVIFSTIPHNNDQRFVKDMDEEYFASYKRDIKSSDNYLYKPLKYYMLGDYDICYISLINNFKFSHRLFETKTTNGEKESHFNSHTFQSYSGFALNKSDTLEDLFNNQPKENFVGVIHLKLNNGLYIGNGLSYIEAIYKHIEVLMDGKPYVLTQTFSWFELSLAIFINTPQELTDLLVKLRTSKFDKIAKEGDLLYKNCLYNCEFINNKKDILKASLFSDTNSNIGFYHELIEKDRRTKIFKDFVELIDNENSKIKLKTEIEWQVKPGHVADLLKVISEHPFLGKCFDLKSKNLVLGKTDYMIQESNSDNLIANFHLVRDLVRDKNCDFFKYARKVRTYVFLEPIESLFENCEKGNHGNLTSEVILDHLAVKTPDFEEINKQLKCLKVSRQLRLKILKILSNYNNGILDPILFTYFLDFTIFKNNLIKNIDGFYENSIKKDIEIKELEKKLNNYIDVFQEGYNVRFLNGYQFENISDFDLDFNSSIQQLLTSYSSVVYEYGKLFYEEKTYFPVLQLNNLDTQSDYISINYSVHQLTSPEFVFATLTKEILNHIKVENKDLILILKKIQDFIPQLKRIINESYFDDLIDSNMIDINYFIIDAIRFKTTFEGNFKLFEHWFWSYNFQNTSLYDSSGMFNEQHLRVEMFRIMLIQKFFSDKKSNPLKDPSPEMYTFWEKHFIKIDLITDKLYEYVRNREKKAIEFWRLDEFIKKMIGSNKKFDDRLTKLEEFNTDIVNFALKDYHNKNKRNITLLKRNWEDGSVLESHFPLYDDVLFAIDQTGGVFFSSATKMQEYFSLNSKYLLNIIDFSAIHKKRFILDLITTNN